MANRYFVGGGTGNWNSTTNWSATSGGASGASVPVASDDVFLDAASGVNTLTVNVTSACLSINCTGFIGTLAGNFGLTVGGNLTLGSGMTNNYTGILTISTTSTITSNNISLVNLILSTAATTKTISGNLTVTGALTISGIGGVHTINGDILYASGNLILGTGPAHIITGTSSIVMNGTGNISATGGVDMATITINFTFNTAGIITITSGHEFYFTTATLTYTAGTIITTGSKLYISGSATLDTNGVIWYDFICQATATITNNSLLTISNNLTYGSGTIITFAGTDGWTTNNFYILTSNNISHVLAAGKTYTVTTYFESIATTSLLKDSLISGTPGTKAIFTLEYAATQNVGYTNAVDIDSSLGQTIWTFNGVVTTTNNWNTFTSNSATQRNYII